MRIKSSKLPLGTIKSALAVITEYSAAFEIKLVRLSFVINFNYNYDFAMKSLSSP